MHSMQYNLDGQKLCLILNKTEYIQDSWLACVLNEQLLITYYLFSTTRARAATATTTTSAASAISNSNESYCTFTLASDVTAGGLPSEQEIAKDLESNDDEVSV